MGLLLVAAVRWTSPELDPEVGLASNRSDRDLDWLPTRLRTLGDRTQD